MTGFGRGEATQEGLTASVELSSLNRKQAEVALSLPRYLTELEIPLRKLILSQVSRGRINAQITLHQSEESSSAFILQTERVLQVEKQFSELADKLGRPMPLTPATILKIPDLLQPVEVDPDLAYKIISEALQRALSSLIEMREREGADLKEDAETRLITLSALLNEITEKAPVVVEKYRENLLSRLGEADLPTPLENLLEDERVVKEIALYADRTDISEEITRLSSHIAKFQEYLGSEEPVGRSLDFLCQEMNREFNTIGSKASDAALAHLVVTGKTEVEKIREQVQNVE